MHRKRIIGAECECIAKSMVTFFKFLLTYKMFYPAMTTFTDQYSLPNIVFDIGQL
jgi:hypothetical protein